MPKKIEHELTAHGETRVDEYYWMRNLEDDKDVREFLLNENNNLDKYKINSDLEENNEILEMVGEMEKIDNKKVNKNLI